MSQRRGDGNGDDHVIFFGHNGKGRWRGSYRYAARCFLISFRDASAGNFTEKPKRLVLGIPVIIEPFYGVTLSSRPHREDAAACLLSPGMAPSAAALPPVWALVMRRVISADTHLLHADSPGWHNLVPSLSGAARTRRPDHGR